MASGRVGNGTVNRELPPISVPGWCSGAERVDFRASIIRNRYLWAVKVLLLSPDRERAFVRFETPESAGVVRAWVPVDELREG